jgi:hypothetical protein
MTSLNQWIHYLLLILKKLNIMCMCLVFLFLLLNETKINKVY